MLATEAERGDYPAAVLHAVAAGKTRYGEIKTQLRAEPARTLDRLVELRLLERMVPVTESARSRRGYYRLADNYLAFYLAVLTRFRVEIDRGLGESILPVLLASLDDHLGMPWEEAFRQHLRRLAAASGLAPDVVAVGPWWSDDGRATSMRWRWPAAVASRCSSARRSGPAARTPLGSSPDCNARRYGSARHIRCASPSVPAIGWTTCRPTSWASPLATSSPWTTVRCMAAPPGRSVGTQTQGMSRPGRRTAGARRPSSCGSRTGRP